MTGDHTDAPPPRSPSERVRRVSVIGCGLMGSAIARTLANAGPSVTVWNRTVDKAQALRQSVEVADSPTRALTADLTLICLSSYDAVREVLVAAESLKDVTVLNLTTGSPAEADDLAQYVLSRGGEYLDGVVHAYPQSIGSPECRLEIGGPSHVYATHRAPLSALGAVFHVSENYRHANVIDAAVTGAVEIPTLLAFVGSAAYCESQGIPASDLLATLRPVMAEFWSAFESFAHAIDTGDGVADQATIGVYAAAARSFHDQMIRDGHPSLMLERARSVLDEAEAAGLGHLGLEATRAVLTLQDRGGADR